MGMYTELHYNAELLSSTPPRPNYDQLKPL
jgi:hypothetical protein